ncbi:MAG: TSCPD domain-containing protein [Clostridia bacterium]|nr:TSCPD domain-containing protein [Clostridia bacterium]
MAALGNSIAVARLVKGRKVNEVYELLKDVKCGLKDTSCSQEMVKAIKKAYDEEEK